MRIVPLGACLLSASLSAAAEHPQPKPIREICVPFADLNVILESGGQRVFMDRDKYESLVKKAQQTAEAAPPHAFSMASAEYEITIEDGRAIIRGQLVIDVAAQGTHAIPLNISGVGLRSATLDGQPALIAQASPGGGPTLFLSGVGQHELKLDLVTPLEVAAARQSLRFRLPQATTGRMRAVVPGNVEVKSGATVLTRTVDDDAEVTRFELLPIAADTTLVMSLNNRTAKSQQVITASNVYVVELTDAYERLHVTNSMKVLHGAVEQFRIAVPAEFEIIDVATPLLSRWEITAAGDQRVLTVRLREPVSDMAILSIAAERTKPTLDSWQLPRLQPLDVASSVSIVGLLVESRLETQSLTAEGLLPIDTRVLTETLPQSVFAAEPGAPEIQTIAAYYAPQAEYAVKGSFTKPTGRVQVVGNTVLTLLDSGLEVRGGFALLPSAERIFGCHFTAPPNWQVTEVSYGDGQVLEFETYEDESGGTRVLVRLPQSVEPGDGYGVYFRATYTPTGWLDPWDTQSIEFPQFTVLEATSDRGAIAVVAADDLSVLAGETTGLTPLDNSRKTEFNLESVATDLALEYDARPFSAQLNVTRKLPRITAETYSFFKLSPGRLDSHYEILYEIGEARAQQLAFRLPADTPDEVSIVGVEPTAVKEFNGQVVGEDRVWTVDLAQPMRGLAHITISFEQPLTAPDIAADANTLEFPKIVADGVEYQTGSISVEGSAELEITLDTDARRVDAGELIDARYQPGRRLLGAFGFVGQPPTISAGYLRPTQHGLPSAIVQRAELVTAVSTTGVSQSAARFLLKTKASFIEVQLPANSTLWSVYLDGAAAKPQRDGDRLLISLPVSSQLQLRNLQVVYETNHHHMGLWANYETLAPQLFLRSQSGAPAVALPTADLEWYVHLPPGYRLAASHGTVHPNLTHAETLTQIAGYESPVIRTAEQVFMGGELVIRGGVAAPAAREAARRIADPSRSLGVRIPAQTEGLADTTSGLLGESVEQSSEQFRDPFGADATADEPVDGDAADAIRGPTDLPAQPSLDGYLESRQAEMPRTAASEPMPPGQSVVGQNKRYWALEGLRSLPIDLTTGERPVLFQSLGQQPELNVRLVHQRRIELLALGASLFVLVLGLGRLAKTWRAKLTYVGGVLILASLIPLLTGLDRELGVVFDWCFFAGLILLPVYILWSCLRWVASYFEHVPGGAVAALLLVALLMSISRSTSAAEPTATLGPLEVKLLEGLPAVEIPADAVIVPFELAGELPTTSERVIVPLETYERLHKLAFPDDDLEHRPPPAPYALAGATWETKLVDGDHLELLGRVSIGVLSEKNVTVLLPLDGGVLRSARLDDQAARVQIIQPQLKQQAQQHSVPNQAAQVGDPSAPAKLSMMAVYIKGPGRHELAMTVHYPLTRRGGWRIAQGHLPAATATSLTMTVPRKDTQVRVSGVADRTSYDTTDDDQQIETALAADGRFQLQWRPMVSQAMVDQSLTVESEAVFDVQEDRLRLMWQLQLKFPRSERESFTLRVPDDYLVEGVDGENIRNWENSGGELRVELLKAARDAQQMTLRMATDSPVRDGEIADIPLPVIQVQDAALHEGRLAIRRSPLIELQATAAQGLMRTDLASVTSVSQAAVVSPLGIRPFQAYEFSRAAFTLALSARPVQTRMTATLQTVLRIGQGERTVETRIAIHPTGQPVYSLIVDVPDDCEVTDVDGPEPFEWSPLPAGEADRQLTLFFGSGQTRDFSVILHGRLGDRGSVSAVALPRFLVRDVQRQETTIVVQTDPSYAVTTEELVNCDTGLLSETHAWLAESQRSLARLAIRSDQTDYSGNLLLTRRTPRVTCLTVSNLRLTERAFEETVLLNYTILDAGIREVSFLLPSDLRDARVDTQLLQSKSVEDVAGNTDVVRFRLTLQDEVIGQLRVLVEHDRLLTTNQRSIPIPTVENARTTQQFVAIESAGRDEVVIDTQQQLEPVSRQQSSWRTLAGILGDSTTQAFLVQASADSPQLVVSTQDRQAVETVTARIAFAYTNLIIDASGAYRAAQRYLMNNRTEQFLTIQLPADASLWTAFVAGEPVKPMSANQADQVRIPLVKTAEGENDYTVELKYGGRRKPMGRFSQVDFPLIKTLNIKVESSQVMLHLPDSHAWFSFGGTMRQVESDGDFLAAYLRYQTEQLTKFTKGLNSSNPYAIVRCQTNIKQLALVCPQLQRQANSLSQPSAELRRSVEDNSRALAAAQRELQRSASAGQEKQNTFGRGNLGRYFNAQANSVANDLVNEQGLNFFGMEQSQDTAESDVGNEGGQIAQEWLENNRLRNDASVMSAAEDSERAGSRVQLQKKRSKGVANYHFELIDEELQQQKDRLQTEVDGQSQRDGVGKVRRFQKRLESQQLPDIRQGQGQSGGRQPATHFAPPATKPAEPAVQSLGDLAAPRPANQPAANDALLAMPAQPGGASRAGGQGAGAGEFGGGGGGFSGMAMNGLVVAPDYEKLGLASLDVALPQRGRIYRFTTPRGDIQIQARAINQSLWFRFTRLLSVLAAIAGVLLCGYLFRSLASYFRASPLWALLLLVAGLAAGVLVNSVLCLALIALAVAVIIRWIWNRSVERMPQRSRDDVPVSSAIQGGVDAARVSDTDA